AIRLRVIPNSNDKKDQSIKEKVKLNVQKEMSQMLYNIDNINVAREKIKSNINNIKKSVKKTLSNEGYDIEYKIDFGYNYFPEKKYKGIIYNEGYYESVLITLGKGEGDNWWCVLFPPLCLLEADDKTDVEYKIYVKELINKYF
ncbi:MAG TPA: stage II sporulation protein R, partial [Tenericutes bacterium]|nr:stage II sporulation protein R [Mycoplasmatota bacterium]